MALRNVSALPSDFDLERMGMRSVSRFVSLWKPRTAEQRLGASTDFVSRVRTLSDGSRATQRSIYTSEGREVLR